MLSAHTRLISIKPNSQQKGIILNMIKTKINLERSFFNEKEKLLMELGGLTVSTFVYSTGVQALRVKNTKGELIILPFQGQQIWRASFCGRDLTMKSIFDEPQATTDFLSNYGCFMLHCGMTGMGNPSPEDTHPTHGELPNMCYDTAFIVAGDDENGAYFEIGGTANYRIAFTTNYLAQPKIKLYENETLFDISMNITNLRNEPLEYLYLCHVNYLPVDGARLVYDYESIKVHCDATEEQKALKEYMEKLVADTKLHNLIDSKTQIYDPEIVFTVKYKTDENGDAKTIMVLPQGDAYYVSFKPEQLPYGIRWISRTGDEDAIGIVLPATAEHKGYIYSKQKGDVKLLAKGETFNANVKVGYLEKRQAEEIIGG